LARKLGRLEPQHNVSGAAVVKNFAWVFHHGLVIESQLSTCYTLADGVLI
jgi:hypothetical protein